VLTVHRSDRADALADALAELLSQPLADPLAPEVVSVPTRGMERWLAQRVSGVLGAAPGGADGVCANVLFPFPQRLLGDAVAAASGIDPDDDPWLPERSAWTLLNVVAEHLAEPWLATLTAYLGAGAPASNPDPVRAARRLSMMRHLAGLYDRYALHRPGMLAAWAEGQDSDAVGVPLPAGAAWQAELWRRLRARIGVPGPAERRRRACERLSAEPALATLPSRFSLFGLTRLPAGQLEVLRALAHGRDVHLFLLHPSPALWSTIAAFGSRGGEGDPAWVPSGDLAAGAGPEAGTRPEAGAGSEAGADSRQPQLFSDSAPEPFSDSAPEPFSDSGQPPAPSDSQRPRDEPPAPVRRAEDPTATLPSNALLASWGRDAREMQVNLTAGILTADTVHPAPPSASGLLARLQADVREDRAAPGAPLPDQPDRRLRLEPEDRSIQVHACHGRARQVEVVRDAILHALAEDETLEPRDVIVMCPDIETFAPLIQATFGAGETFIEEAEEQTLEPLPAALRPTDLRVRLADRSLRQTNPLLGVVARLLELAEQRMTASEVLDLADRPPVRRRFRLDDDDLTRLQGWIAQAGIRWGLDSAHRERFRLERVPSGTWAAGLERLLLGVAMTEDGQRLFADVLPLDDVDSRAIDLAGRLAELVERLGAALDDLGRTQPLVEWAQAIGEAADAIAATPVRDRWQRAELQRLLDDVVAEAGEHGGVELTPTEIRAYLLDRLAGRPTRANFRTGHLTVCTLMPMRSVPHRVVCLLGLDDGAFPRKTPRDGDDLMLADPLLGERDPRSEDRQLLLDALMATTGQLIVTYTGNDERTNTPRPPAVPVGELLDVIDTTATGAARPGTDPIRPATDQVLIRHPLQPFDPRNFERGALAGDTAWSFDRVTLEGARALAAPRSAQPPFLSEPLAPVSEAVIELEDLIRFVEHPVRAFLRQRLGISLGRAMDDIADALPVELDGLERWAVGQRLLEARLAGVDGTTAIKAEIARGTLPPGRLGRPVVDAVYPLVEAIAAEAASVATVGPAADPIDIRVELAGGRRLSGTVSGVSGDVLLSATYSRVAAKHRLAAWVRLLALAASQPEREFKAATVGRAGGRDDVRVSRVGPLATTPADREALARAQLEALIDLRDRGLREPLPLFCATSAAYAAAAVSGQDPVAAAEREWRTEWQFDREDREPEHQYVLGGVRTLSELLEIVPRPDEVGEGWAEEEPSRLGRLARRLWAGLLDREEVVAR
jgi:exodeoxyribonuclease V gamma subunit